MPYSPDQPPIGPDRFWFRNPSRLQGVPTCSDGLAGSVTSKKDFNRKVLAKTENADIVQMYTYCLGFSLLKRGIRHGRNTSRSGAQKRPIAD